MSKRRRKIGRSGEQPSSGLSFLPKGGEKIIALALAMTFEIMIYALIIKTEFIIGYVGLYVVTAILAVAAFLFSGGGMSSIPTHDELRDDWSYSKKEKLIKFLTKGRVITKKIQIVLLPLLFILGFDIIKTIFFS